MASGIGEVSILQPEFQVATHPATRFVALLHAALTGGLAHVADRKGGVPVNPERWGWLCQRNGRKWVPQGLRVGWVTGDDVFLEPKSSYQVARQLAGAERLGVCEQALRQRLRDQGLLTSIDVGRQMSPFAGHSLRRPVACRPDRRPCSCGRSERRRS